MTWINDLFSKLFPQKTQKRIIWSGTISSDGPEQQGPITVLALRTEFDKNEFSEGCDNALIDFNTFRPMEKNLNYPISPYARGYIETYRGNLTKRVDEVFAIITENQDNDSCKELLEEKYRLKSGGGLKLIMNWAINDRVAITNFFYNADSYVLKATNE